MEIEVGVRLGSWRGIFHGSPLPALLVLAFIFMMRPARADDSSQPSGDAAPVTSHTLPPGLLGPRGGPPVELTLSVENAFKASFKDYPGSLSVNRELLSVWAVVGADPIFVKLEVDDETSNYGFTDARDIIFGTSDPIHDTLMQVTVGPKLYGIFDPWVFYLAPSLAFCGAPDAPIDRSLRFELDGAARYEIEPDLKITFGLGFRTRIEASLFYYPILGIEWGRLKLELQGATFKATYAAIPDVLDVRASMAWEYWDFRLPHGAPVSYGVIHDEDTPLKVGFGWKPVRGIEADLDVGTVCWRKLIVDDHDGTVETKASLGPAAFLAFQVVIDL